MLCASRPEECLGIERDARGVGAPTHEARVIIVWPDLGEFISSRRVEKASVPSAEGAMEPKQSFDC
ncbi:hypothetical protein WM40_17235 [Robbsia andropogonis]|uniref:Uncharacterized protein n=1 Tax=Robbsia andropogonis TaxID=28092 RepID=A0A0F5JXG1_9BURK|nr:hypothetical protein WM40_17235 [Robbsia andropogonis]